MQNSESKKKKLKKKNNPISEEQLSKPADSYPLPTKKKRKRDISHWETDEKGQTYGVGKKNESQVNQWFSDVPNTS